MGFIDSVSKPSYTLHKDLLETTWKAGRNSKLGKGDTT